MYCARGFFFFFFVVLLRPGPEKQAKLGQGGKMGNGDRGGSLKENQGMRSMPTSVCNICRTTEGFGRAHVSFHDVLLLAIRDKVL